MLGAGRWSMTCLAGRAHEPGRGNHSARPRCSCRCSGTPRASCGSCWWCGPRTVCTVANSGFPPGVPVHRTHPTPNPVAAAAGRDRRRPGARRRITRRPATQTSTGAVVSVMARATHDRLCGRERPSAVGVHTASSRRGGPASARQRMADLALGRTCPYARDRAPHQSVSTSTPTRSPSTGTASRRPRLPAT